MDWSEIIFTFILTSSIIHIPNSLVFGWERVVTDPTLIHSEFGVSLDFRYNESTTENRIDGRPGTRIASSAGCPRSANGIPWVYVGNPIRCYLVGTRGPCLPGQLVFGNGTANYGRCDCICPNHLANLNGHNASNTASLKPSNFLFCNFKISSLEFNEAVLDIQSGSCYFLETQGACPIGKWMVKDESGLNTTCVPQCSLGAGPFAEHRFHYGTRKCIKKRESDSSSSVLPIALAGGLSANQCDEGMKYSRILNRCVPKFDAFVMNSF